MPTKKSSQGSQATGSQEGLLPKVEETMKTVGSSKDIARRLMKAAGRTPFPKVDDDEFKDPSASAERTGKVSGKVSGKDLDGSLSGKDINEGIYGKAGNIRRRVQRTEDSTIG